MIDHNQLQQLILSGSLVCSKEDVAKLAGIQLRISEINAYVQQQQEPQQLVVNPAQTKQQNAKQANIANYSQPNSSKTPPSSGDIFTRGSFEQPVQLSQPTYNPSVPINNQLASTPTSVVTPLYSSTTGASVKLHPISEYGYKVCFSISFFHRERSFQKRFYPTTLSVRTPIERMDYEPFKRFKVPAAMTDRFWLIHKSLTSIGNRSPPGVDKSRRRFVPFD